MSEVTDNMKTEAEVPVALTVATPVKFHFKEDKLGKKRATIELSLPFLTIDGVVEGLSDDKQRDYILTVLNDAVYVAARQQVGDEEKPVNTQEELDISKLSLEFLANQPAAERRGGGIAKETWEEFGKDYLEIMPAVTGKNLEQIGNAVKIFTARMQPVKTQKAILSYLQEQIALWATHTKKLEDFQEVYEFVDNKIKTLLAADETALLANL